MKGQISIFDWMPEAVPAMTFPDIKDIHEAEAVRIVGEQTGVEFAYNESFRQWIGKAGKLKLDLEYDHYILEDKKDLFLSVGYSIGTSGGGSPCDSIEEALEYIRNVKKRYSI